MPMTVLGFPVRVTGQVPIQMPAEHRASITNNQRKGVAGTMRGSPQQFQLQQLQSTVQPASWPNADQVLANSGAGSTRRVNTSFLNIKKFFGQLMGHGPFKIPDGDYVQGVQRDTSVPGFGQNRESMWQPDTQPTVPPTRITRPQQSDIGSWAGIQQHGFAQTFGGMTDSGALVDASGGAVWPPPPGSGYDGRSLILTPAFIPRPTTTGIRSISGVTARGRYGQASNRRIPAVYVPVQV